jgi:peptide/nickel transport system substrate-binding protein
MRMRLLVAGVVAAVGLAGLTACSSDENDGGGSPGSAGGEVRLAFEGLPETWTPHGGAVEAWLRAPYEALLRVPTDPASTEYEPELATEWTVEDLAITLRLREGVTFHDGTDFNAEAVKVNLDDTKDGGGPLSANLSSVASVDVVDDYTVKINLKNSDPGLLRVLGTSTAYMGSPAALEDGSIDSAPVGTGPWQYDAGDSVTGGEQVFTAFADYWGDKPAGRPDTLRIQAIDDPQARVNALLTGEVDVADIDPGLVQQAKDGGFDTYDYPALLVGLSLFDRSPDGSLGDVNVRRAVCSSVNTQDLLDAWGVGEVSKAQDQRWTEGSPYYVEDIQNYPYDTEAAATFLSDAGNPDVAINMATFQNTAAASEALQGQLAEVGVDLSLESLDVSQFFATWNGGKYALGLASMDGVHPAQWYDTYFAATGPSNPSGWEPPELAQAAQAAKAAGSGPESDAAWQKVVGIIYEQALTCADFALAQVTGYDSGAVSGIEAPPYEGGTFDYKPLVAK